MANETVADMLERPRSHRENRKKDRGRKVEDNQAQAIAKFIRVQPRKARLVIDEVRGRYAEEALSLLRFIPNRAAGYISKVLSSAMANAVNNHGLHAPNLKLIEARVDEGPRMKRVQPRAQGRAYRILKRTSHITIIVQEVEPKPRKPKKPTGGRAQAARAAKQTPGRQAVAAPEAAKPAVSTVAPEEELIVSPAVEVAAQAPDVLEDTALTAAAPEQANETPELTGADSEAAQPAEETDLGPQSANTEDTTDEIGAPIETDADKA